MKKITIICCLFASIGFAQIPVGYYNPAAGLTKNPLKLALHNIIKGHTTISYAALWTAFKKTDIKSNGKVWDIYSNVTIGLPPYEFIFVTDQCGSYAVEGDCYNREHSWPQSWFNSLAGPVSDLFHIYPTDGKVNGQRSNYPYGNVTTASWTSLNGGKLGPCTNPGYNLTVFEPIDEYKGDLARGYFYMCTRYYSEDGTWSFSDATNKSDILPWEMNVLLQWSHLDPVSLKEKSRNDSIYYKFQNNRNPFIDHPEWADSIWAGTTSVFVEEIEFSQSFSVFPNPALNTFTILNKSNNKTQDVMLQVTSITGELIEKQSLSISESTPIDCSKWAKGVYFINISNKNSVSNFKFIKQ